MQNVSFLSRSRTGAKLGLAAVVLLASLLLAVVVAVPAAWAQDVTATLRIEYVEGTMMPPITVTVPSGTTFDDLGLAGANTDPGFVTALHVLLVALDEVHGPGAGASMVVASNGNINSIGGSSGSSVSSGAFWMHALNQTQPADAGGMGFVLGTTPVSNGDSVEITGMFWDMFNPTWMTFFDRTTFSATTGESFDVRLRAHDPNDWSPGAFNVAPAAPIAGAEILIDPLVAGTLGASSPSGFVSNAQGVASITLNEPGTYVLSARRLVAGGATSDITRPFAVVEVAPADTGGGAGPGNGGPGNGGGGQDPNPDMPDFDTSPPANLSVQWGSFRGNTFNSAITNAATLTSTQSGVAAWTHRVGTSGMGLTSPVQIDGNFFIASRTTLYRLNSAGQVTGTTTLFPGTGVATFLAAGSGQVFVPVGHGSVQAINAQTMTTRWISESFDNNWQKLGALTYANGFLYGAAGFDITDLESNGTFFCLNALTGERVWTYNSPQATGERGFYWSGAAVTDSAVLFAGDDGVLVSHRIGAAGAVDGVISTASLSGGVRSSVLFVEGVGGAGFAYVATRNGYVNRVAVAADGTLGAVQTRSLTGINSTSTPVEFRNRLYVVSGERFVGGTMDVLDATTLEVLRSVALPGFSQSSPLLVATGAQAANGYEVSLYIALNDQRDDLVRIVDSESASLARTDLARTNAAGEIRAEAVYRPGGSFTLSSVTIDEVSGRLLYVDGSGYFTAIAASNNPLPPADPEGDPPNGDGTLDPEETPGGSGGNSGSDESTTTTRVPSVGPATYDMNVGATAFFLAAVLALMIAAATAAKIIDDRRSKQLDELEEYDGDGDYDYDDEDD